jgi:hypothetical protein
MATAAPYGSWGSPAARAAWVRRRAQAAVVLLVLGGEQAMGLRTRAWVVGERGAQLSEETLRLAAQNPMTVDEADMILGPDSRLRDTIQAQMGPGDITAISWLLDVARVTSVQVTHVLDLTSHQYPTRRAVPGLDQQVWFTAVAD